MAKKTQTKEKETKKIVEDVKKEKDVKDSKIKNVKKTKKKEKAPKEGFFSGLGKELKLVKWPSAKEIVKYTLATLVLCIILVAFFEVLNLIMAYVKGLFN